MNECPYKYIDSEVILFNDMFNANKSHGNIYGTFIDTPYILNEYFKLFGNEVIMHKKHFEEMRQENKAISSAIMKGKPNG